MTELQNASQLSLRSRAIYERRIESIQKRINQLKEKERAKSHYEVNPYT
jgi:hypothetical protein